MANDKDANSISNSSEDSSGDAPHSYTSHNFDSMNRAIDNQIQKQELMSVIYRGQRYENSSRTVLFLVSTLAITALTATLIWWLIAPGQPSFRGAYTVNEDNQALQTLSGQERVEGSEAPFIDTSFTVFHRNLTPSGDYVVTGKTYAPSDLKKPSEQYCYLEAANATGELSGKPLAAYNGNEFVMETVEPIFVDLATAYCRFTKLN